MSSIYLPGVAGTACRERKGSNLGDLSVPDTWCGRGDTTYKGTPRKGCEHREKSEELIVPMIQKTTKLLRREGALPEHKMPKQRGRGDCPKGLATPNKLQELQRQLYSKSKSEKKYRFYTLYDKVYRGDVLEEAWKRVRANKGSPGVDGEAIEAIEERGVAIFLRELQEELQGKRYRPEVIRRTYIPKRDGGKRPLGIPIVKDRIVQAAVKLIVEPIFEADFQGVSYGFRPKRSPQKAVGQVRRYLAWQLNGVVDADITACFENIPHKRLMVLVAKRIGDGNILRLIKGWLKAGVMEDGQIRRSKVSGTPQGGVISPLLANIYLNEVDKYWVENKVNTFYGLNAQYVRYADDLVILSPMLNARKVKELLKGKLDEMGLELNPKKTQIVDADKDSFDFLGFNFRRVWDAKKQKYVPLVLPSQKATQAIRAKIKEIARINRPHVTVEGLIKEVNPIVRGWVNYFRTGNSSKAFTKLRSYTAMRIRKFMRRRRNQMGFGWKIYSGSLLFHKMGLYNDYRVVWTKGW